MNEYGLLFLANSVVRPTNIDWDAHIAMPDMTPSECLERLGHGERDVERDASPSQDEKRPITGIKVCPTHRMVMYLLTVAVVSTGSEHFDR